MILLFLSILVDINTIGENSIGKIVTIEGVVTVAPDRLSMGDLYIIVQDNTGGIPIWKRSYDIKMNNFDYEEKPPERINYKRWDKVKIKGIVSLLKNEIVLIPVTEEIIDHNKRVKPKEIKLNDIKNYLYRYVSIKNVKANSPFPRNMGDSSFVKINDGKTNSFMYISPYNGISGRVFPEGYFDLFGVVIRREKRYAIFPENPGDIKRTEEKPHIIIGPLVSTFEDGRVRIFYKTFEDASTIVEYGENMLNKKLIVNDNNSNHIFEIAGLNEKRDYKFRIIATNRYGSDTSTVKEFNTNKKDAFTFVSMGDSRGPNAYHPLPGDTFKMILHNIARRDPDFVIFTGDNVYGYCDSIALSNEWDVWLSMMDTLSNHNIPYYVALGNHEASNDPSGTRIFQFRMLQNPDNGPGGFYSKTVGSFNFGNSHFVLLNSDPINDGNTQTSIIDSMERSWLMSDLASATGAHIFTFQHKEAFPPSDTSSHSSLAFHITARDSFWEILLKYKVDANIASHIHLFNKDFFGRTLPDGYKDVRQIINGTCGAPIVPTYGGNFFHYIFWKISGDTVKGDVYDENDMLRDTIYWVHNINAAPRVFFSDSALFFAASIGSSVVNRIDTLKNDNGKVGGFNSVWADEKEAVRIVPESKGKVGRLMFYVFTPDTALDSVYSCSVYIWKNQEGYPGTSVLSDFITVPLKKGRSSWVFYIPEEPMVFSDTFWIGVKKTNKHSPYNLFDTGPLMDSSNVYYINKKWRYESYGGNYIKRVKFINGGIPHEDTASLIVKNEGNASYIVYNVSTMHSWDVRLSQDSFLVFPDDSVSFTIISSTYDLSPLNYYDTLIFESNIGLQRIPMQFDVNPPTANDKNGDIVFENPIVKNSTLKLYIYKSGHVSLSLFDLTGRRIEKMLDENMNEGYKFITFPDRIIPSGVYFLHLKINNEIFKRKLIYLK